jgi:hypothetical protein
MDGIAAAGGTGQYIPASSDQFADVLLEVVGGIDPCEPMATDTEFLVTCEYQCTSIDNCQEKNGTLLFGEEHNCGENTYCCELPETDTGTDSDNDMSTDTGAWQGTCVFDCIDPFAGDTCPGTILTGPTNQCVDSQQCCDPDTPPPPCTKECLAFEECSFITYVANTECDSEGLACCDPVDESSK